ncbi:DNA-methyltransferase [Mitsuokella multacida]|jgi:site-specific DNA-methyltransferase (adenine-specific)
MDILNVDNIYAMNCIVGMKSRPSDSVDLIIADPPYNLSKGGDWKWDNSVQLDGMGGNWNKVMESWDDYTLETYFEFTKEWLTEAKRILKPTGSMWIFGTYHNIGIINVVCQLLKIEIINEVIWYKKNAFPNLSGRRLTASHETLLWCNKGIKKREYYFNYNYSKNGNFSKDELKRPGKQMRTVWDISNNKDRKELVYGKHPTQKPIKILKRMIRLSSKVGDLMLTPFAGAGSECVAAKECQRHYIGFEIDKEYISIAQERLKNTHIESNEEKIDNPDEIDRNMSSKEGRRKKKKDNQLSIFDVERNTKKGNEDI